MSELCTYCGDDKECRDHAVPVLHIGVRINGISQTVPCCNECNHFKGGEVFNTWHDLYQFLAQKYRHKYRRLLATPNWSEDELQELRRSLRSFVESQQMLKRLVRLKIGMLEVASRKSCQNAVQTTLRPEKSHCGHVARP